MTLEADIKKRVEAIRAEKADQQKQALTADQQAQKAFDAACKKLADLAKSLGVKEVTPAKFGESGVPFVTFTVLDVPVAIESRASAVGDYIELLVDGARIDSNQAVYFKDDQPDLKERLSATLTEAVAQALHDRTPPAEPDA